MSSLPPEPPLTPAELELKRRNRRNAWWNFGMLAAIVLLMVTMFSMYRQINLGAAELRARCPEGQLEQREVAPLLRPVVGSVPRCRVPLNPPAQPSGPTKKAPAAP